MSDEITEERVREILKESLAENGLEKIVEIFKKEHHIHRGSHRGEIIGKEELRTEEFSLDDFKDSESRKALTAQETWIAPTLLNSWVDFGGEYNPAGYFKDSLGIVHIRGLVKDGTLPGTIFVLPESYRPAYYMVFSTSSVSAFGEARVAPTGEVSANVGNNGWFSLDVINFRVA